MTIMMSTNSGSAFDEYSDDNNDDDEYEQRVVNEYE